jgi:hypothetical protein
MTVSKFIPIKNSNTNVRHYNEKNYDENGVFFQHGNGCEKYKSCFECELPDCTWDAGNECRTKGVKNENN